MKMLSGIAADYPSGKDLAGDQTRRGALLALANKLSEELSKVEEKRGGCLEFAQVLNSAAALILAIKDTDEFRLSASSPKKSPQSVACPGGKPSIPTSLH